MTARLIAPVIPPSRAPGSPGTAGANAAALAGALVQAGLERVRLAGAVGAHPGGLRRGERRLRGWHGLFASGGHEIRFREAGAVRGDAPPGGLGEVLPQVEPVSDLDRP
jgi:hypothetical protein